MTISRIRTISAATSSSEPLMFANTLIASRLYPAAPVTFTDRPSDEPPARSRIDWTASWNVSLCPSPGSTGCTTIAARPLGEKTGGCALPTSGLRPASSLPAVSEIRRLSAPVSPLARS